MIQAYDAVFFSPHQDDAVLSCGALIASMTAKNMKVCVCTVFNRYSGISGTPVIRHYLSDSGCKSAHKLERVREAEDCLALKILSVSRYCFNLTDAAFRGYYPEFKNLFGGHVADRDGTELVLADKLSAFLKTYMSSETKIYVPSAVGLHVDHILVFRACASFFRKPFILWEDVPYGWNCDAVVKRLIYINPKKQLMNRKIFNGIEFRKVKQKAVEAYRSQLLGLRRNGLSNIMYDTEYYYQYYPE